MSDFNHDRLVREVESHQEEDVEVDTIILNRCACVRLIETAEFTTQTEFEREWEGKDVRISIFPGNLDCPLAVLVGEDKLKKTPVVEPIHE